MSEIAVQEEQERSPLRKFRDEFSSEGSLAELRAALPENVSVDKFRRALLTAVNEKPELVEVYQQNPGSLFSSLTRCAAAGLLPDGKQAAINVYNSKTKVDNREVWLPTAQFLPMIAGLRLIAAEHGWDMRTRVVFANDEFDYTEEPPSITHRPAKLGTERGERIAAYAVAVHRDGRRVQRVLNAAEVAKRREKAKTKKIWDEHPDPMWEKSAGHALFDHDIPLGERETERIRRLLTETDIDPLTGLYGPKRPELAAVPDGAATDADAQAAGGDGGPQAAPASSAGAAPGSFDYSNLAGDGSGTPAPEPGGDASTSPAPAETVAPDSLPGGFGGKTLAEIAASERGRDVLKMVLLNAPAHDEFRAAVETFVQASVPEVWKAYCDAKFGSES